jgi:sulfur-carrier protein
MQINFYADLRPPAGGKTVEVNVQAPMTARQVLETVTDSRPELGKKIWQSPGALFDHIHVFVNGRQSVFLPLGLETVLDSADVLDVFPPVGGGQAKIENLPREASDLPITHVTLKFTGEVWERMHQYRMDLTFEGATLGDLLKALFAQYDLRDLVLDPDNQFIPRSGVLVNGRSAKYIGALAALIQEGDEVIIMRPSVAAI